ncbi:hypothetical protein ACFS5L_15885 [Streptomyces phyllanthi]|uniref:Uncharacterized protein n=1 Tax=Streptomyces phyllanthi TaxID=1803180 RepID=A0A5N8VW35_9ACTN|nr:hypothetical protein [Streptomyces phyllanthi]MPY38906.1 hypothetical protein [Streptomyces phyllanthi]
MPKQYGQSGRVRLLDGQPWDIEITEPGGHREPYTTQLLRAGDPRQGGVRRVDIGPFTPTYADLDHTLGLLGLVRGGTERSGTLEAGKVLELFRWHHGPRDDPAAKRAAVRLALSRGVESLTVTLPVAEAGRLRTALLDEIAREGDSFRAEELVELAAALDEADGVRVLLSVLQATDLPGELRRGRYSAPDQEVSPELDRLAALIEQSRFSSGPWQSLRQTLQDTLRAALAHPGAQGLAARDELLELLARFAWAHRGATRADDTEQQRLQAERSPVPEAASPARPVPDRPLLDQAVRDRPALDEAVVAPVRRARRRWPFTRR